jgi:pimeloyl-ACP methyl ester carboxylesterase
MESLPEPQVVDLDGPVSYRVWDGPAEASFVLIHGLGGACVNWMRVADGLAGLGRVYALDLPGYGLSPLQGRGAGLMDHRRVVGRFMHDVIGGSAFVCGNSMGGVIAILQAAVEPDLVNGLVLTAAAMPPVSGARPHPLIRSAFAIYDLPAAGEAMVAARMRYMSPEQLVRVGFRVTAERPHDIPEDVVRAHVQVLRQRIANDPQAAHAFVESARSLLRLGRSPGAIRRAFDGVRCPVLVLHGRRDRLVPARWAEATLARHRDWHGRFYPDLGHVPQLEAPGRWLSDVADWFSGLGR